MLRGQLRRITDDGEARGFQGVAKIRELIAKLLLKTTTRTEESVVRCSFELSPRRGDLFDGCFDANRLIHNIVKRLTL